MARNYDVIHQIQSDMSMYDNKTISAVVKMFNRVEERKSYASALSTSITLFLAMKYLGVNASVILGTLQFQNLSYPHAWLEINGNIFDIATHIDVLHHPVLNQRNLTPVSVQIDTTYETASFDGLDYYPFQFGGTWPLADMKRMVGKTFAEYADNSPYFDIYADVCYILDLPETKDNIEKLVEIAKTETIKDEE